jgi:hypothetical protein
LWYHRIAIGICTGAGGIMLIGAAIVDTTQSLPLLVIGGAWFLMGLAGIRQARRQVREIVIDGAQVMFRYRTRNVVIPAQEISEVSWAWWDPNHVSLVRIRTISRGIIKVPSRMQGFLDFLIELRRVNPGVKISD